MATPPPIMAPMGYRSPWLLAIWLSVPPLIGSGTESTPVPPRDARFQSGPDQSEAWTLPDYDDSRWSPVSREQLPMGWHATAGGPRGVGAHGRYRLYFDTPAGDQAVAWMISAGFVGNISEAWWNGRRLGGWGGEVGGVPTIPPQRTVHAWPLGAADFRKDGQTNVLAIQVRNICGTGGLLGGPTGLFPAADLSRLGKRLESHREATVMLVTAFALIWALLFIVVRLTGDDSQPWLFAAGLFSCTGAVHATGSQFFASGEWVGDPRWVLAFIVILFWTVPILSVWMVRGLCEGRGRRRELWATAAAVVLAAVAQRPGHTPPDAILAYSALLLLAGGVILSRAWRGWRSGSVAAPAVLVGTVCLALAAAWQIALFAAPAMKLAASSWQPMDLGIIASVGSIGGTLLRRYSKARIRERELTADVLETARIERSRVGRQLHDGVAQDLQYLLLTAKRLRGDQTDAASTDELVRGLGEAIGEIRRAAEDLQPLALRGATLREALEALVSRLTDRHGIPVTLSIGQLPELIDPERDAIFRVAQEAIQNACRHAGANSVALSVGWEDGAILIQVTDDGRGFDPRTLGGDRLGLKFLRNQAELAGGHLRIDSVPGRGTLLVYRMPVSKRKPRLP